MEAVAKRLSEETGESWDTNRVKNYMKENGLTCHECADRKTVRFIPTKVNAAFKHTGGIGVQNSMDAMSKELDRRTDGFNFSLKKESPHDGGMTNTMELNNAINESKKAFRNAKKRKTP
jgi:hypothetical protein